MSGSIELERTTGATFTWNGAFGVPKGASASMSVSTDSSMTGWSGTAGRILTRTAHHACRGLSLPPVKSGAQGVREVPDVVGLLDKA